MKGQPRHMSLVESLVNVLVGYSVAVLATAIILPAFGYPVTLHENLAISGLFTIVSICRSYVLRRAFNWWHVQS